MNKADIIINILDTILASDDIDKAILDLTKAIEYVTLHTATPIHEQTPPASSQALLSR